MKRICFILCIIVNTLIYGSEIDKFKIMTETYFPYNFKENNELKGLSVDLLDEMLKNVGSSITKKEFELLPWARAYNMIQKKPNTLLFTMFKTKQREDMFKWVGPVDTQIIGLIARKDRNIKINSLDDVKQYKIGTVKDDVAESLLFEKGLSKNSIDSLSGTNSIEKSIKKLDSKRIDLFSYMANMKQWKIENFDPNEYETVYVLQKTDLYYAFNKNTDDKIINELQKSLDQLKKSGVYKKIYNKYK